MEKVIDTSLFLEKSKTGQCHGEMIRCQISRKFIPDRNGYLKPFETYY